MSAPMSHEELEEAHGALAWELVDVTDIKAGDRVLSFNGVDVTMTVESVNPVIRQGLRRYTEVRYTELPGGSAMPEGSRLRRVIVSSDAERLSELRAAVDEMAHNLVEMCDGSVFRTMACREVESIAAVLRSNGNEMIADLIIEDHADYDQPGDEHYPEQDGAPATQAEVTEPTHITNWNGEGEHP